MGLDYDQSISATNKQYSIRKVESRGTLWPRLGVSGARMGVRGSALNSCAQEQFNDLLRSPAAILNSCRHTPNKKKGGSRAFTDLLRSPDTILHDCQRSHGHPGPADRGLMGILVQPTVLETFGNSGGNS